MNMELGTVDDACPPHHRRWIGRLAFCLALAAVTVALVFAAYGWQSRRALSRGIRMVGEGDYRAAIQPLIRAVAAAPGNAEAHFYLGMAYLGAGVRAGAIAHLVEAVRAEPHDARFHDGLGRAYRDAGAEALALREFVEATRLDPNEPRYDVDLAGHLLGAGRAREAAEWLRRAVALNPRSVELRLLFATALKRAGDREGVLREYTGVSRQARDNPTRR
jgi:Flp pilus assembly protein TadD